MQTTALFIFRRDLRLNDNTALLAALEQADHVVPCFIFDPAQVGNANHYKSSNALQFMVESLDDLAAQLAAKGGKLHLFYGNPSDVVATLIAQEGISAVYVNNDYTPFSVKRDKALAAVCKKHDVDFCAYDDALLNPPAAACKKDGTPYSVFTPYFNNASTIPVAKPVQNRHTNYATVSQKEVETKTILDTVNNDLFVRGGRAEAKKILAGLERYRHYEQERDLPAVAGTTGLAAHLKFGTCSVREAYYAIVDALGKQHAKIAPPELVEGRPARGERADLPLLKQLYWRDFFTHVAHFSSHVFGHAFNQHYEHIKWQSNMHHFKRWCQGMTGFPIVDAGMRQLNATGWMHNRVRMIVASFLVKDLHIDWRMGEQYFAIKLVDYDPAVNNGNWQWAASTGCDAQPYFRIFNPWLQQQKFDPTCAYIKQWVPELAKLSPAHIHTWDKTSVQPAKPYPKPMVDHAVVSKEAIALFKKYEK